MMKLLSSIALLFFLASCSSLKSLNFTNKKESPATNSTSSTEPKFIDRINVTVPSNEAGNDVNRETKELAGKDEISRVEEEKRETNNNESATSNRHSAELESANQLQLKYSVLLNTNVEQLQNVALLKGVDEWYGTRYRMGGTTKKGIDCSAFVCAVFASVYGITLPRMARDQYRSTRRISRTNLQEGDLLFFNTIGGVSHVGIYLQNNKFVHASTGHGVTVSDMFENYYMKRFIGAGRIENKITPVATN